MENEFASTKIKKWAQRFMTSATCPECKGSRLKQESLYFKILNKNIAELSEMDIITLQQWFEILEPQLSKKQQTIAKEVIKEIRKRIKFLLDVGLDYLTLNRSSKSLFFCGFL